MICQCSLICLPAWLVSVFAGLLTLTLALLIHLLLHPKK